MALPEFASEADFRQKWIKPFLGKLGFVHVVHHHGPGEQGKDFFFADYDRFENCRFYALQAKLGNIGVGRELDEILDQVKRCFTVKLRFHKDGHERRVSAVYVMVTGKISPEAQERIHDWCVGEHFGENVFFLDGDKLDRLEANMSLQADRELRQRLFAVQKECETNVTLLEASLPAFARNENVPVRCRLVAINQILLNPPPEALIPYNLIQLTVQMIELANKSFDLLEGINVNREQLLRETMMVVDETTTSCRNLERLVVKASDELLTRMSIKVDLVSDKESEEKKP